MITENVKNRVLQFVGMFDTYIQAQVYNYDVYSTEYRVSQWLLLNKPDTTLWPKQPISSYHTAPKQSKKERVPALLPAP